MQEEGFLLRVARLKKWHYTSLPMHYLHASFRSLKLLNETVKCGLNPRKKNVWVNSPLFSHFNDHFLNHPSALKPRYGTQVRTITLDGKASSLSRKSRASDLAKCGEFAKTDLDVDLDLGYIYTYIYIYIYTFHHACRIMYVLPVIRNNSWKPF